MLICQSKLLGKIDLNCREVQQGKVFDWSRKVSFVFTYDSYQKDQETIKGSNLHKLSNLISKKLMITLLMVSPVFLIILLTNLL